MQTVGELKSREATRMLSSQYVHPSQMHETCASPVVTYILPPHSDGRCHMRCRIRTPQAAADYL